MYESRHHPPVSRREFAKRLSRNIGLAFLILIFSMGLGVWGYSYFAGLGLVDALYNASMILTGMGPVAELRTDGAKLFASFYALYSGVAFLTTIAVVLIPVLHRIMHLFHFKTEE